MTLVLIGKDLVLEGSRLKLADKQVPGVHVYIYIHTFIHTYIHACIHTYRQTYIHTYIHTYDSKISERSVSARPVKFGPFSLSRWS